MVADAYPRSNFTPFTPFASLDPFSQPLIRAEWFCSPDGYHLQVRQYAGNFDEGEILLNRSISVEDGPQTSFDPATVETSLLEAGWRVTGPWSRGPRGGLDAVVAPA